MTIFDKLPMGEPGLKDVYQWVNSFISSNSDIAHTKIIGQSAENRDIPAVFITNRELPDEDKQIAIATLARHGQELGARVVGPSILEFLASDEAKEIRDTQLVIVVPVCNPDGFVRNEFHSSMTSLTKTERLVLGKLFNDYPPDALIDYHSLGKIEGAKNDRGDMEVIIPANTTRWAMDEQIHQYVAQKMLEAAEDAGWPYEIHTLEDLATYYFGGDAIGNMPWTYLREKVYLLNLQDNYDNYDVPAESAYTNYTCAPAYLKWHTLVFGMETNHWALTDPRDIGASGMVPCASLLKMGSTRMAWERDKGYPANLLHGDFRISIRPLGNTASERRLSRTKIWHERKNFSLPQREMVDEKTTLARVRYFGRDFPMEYGLCLRMRQNNIEKVVCENRELEFETFKDKCSTFLFIPMVQETAGTVELQIIHP